MSATLASLSSPNVVTVSSEASAHHAAQLMREHHVGSLVVVNAQAPKGAAKPMGIITDRDLVLAVMAEGLDAALFTVGDVMSVDLVTAPASADLLDAVNLMRQNRVRRLVVLDEAGKLQGLAALEDLLEVLARELGGLVLALRGARDRERTHRR
jgi:CBS domain-containing protein